MSILYALVLCTSIAFSGCAGSGSKQTADQSSKKSSSVTESSAPEKSSKTESNSSKDPSETEKSSSSEESSETESDVSGASSGDESDVSGESSEDESDASGASSEDESDTSGASSGTESSASEGSTTRTVPDYEHNDYYDVVETATYTSAGSTVVVHKVKAKQDVSILGTMSAYDEDGEMIGESTDRMILTKDEINYVKYIFSKDISDAELKTQANLEANSLIEGDRSAVEMVSYDYSNDTLNITFKQVTDEVGEFAKFKLLLYKDDEIINTQEGHFSVYAKNLSDKDSTDTVSLWLYNFDFDNVEYVFEP